MAVSAIEVLFQHACRLPEPPLIRQAHRASSVHAFDALSRGDGENLGSGLLQGCIFYTALWARANRSPFLANEVQYRAEQMAMVTSKTFLLLVGKHRATKVKSLGLVYTSDSTVYGWLLVLDLDTDLHLLSVIFERACHLTTLQQLGLVS